MTVLSCILHYSRPYRKYVAGMITASGIISICSMLHPLLMKQLIDTVAGARQGSLWIIFGLYGAVEGAIVLGWTMVDYFQIRYVPSFRVKIAAYFMNRWYTYPYAFFQSQLSGSLTAKVGDAFNLMPLLIFTLFNRLPGFGVMILASMWMLSGIFALIMMGWISLFLAITWVSMKKINTLSQQYAEEKANLMGLVADYMANILNVKLFAALSTEQQRFLRLQKTYLDSAYRQGIYVMKWYGGQGLLSLMYVVILVLLLILGVGQVTPGDYALVITANFRIIQRTFELSGILRDFVSDWGTVHQALKLVELSPEIQDKPNAQPLHLKQGQIALKEVTFAYPGASPLFHNLSITLEGGQKIGLVGYSGGGKSTFINLILRLYEVNQGCVLIDGQDIRDVTQDSLHQAIALVPQDPVLFHRSLMDNIRYGRSEATEKEVITAAKRAHAHGFISHLPQGYETLVGERGVRLSGGQRQRIALARAVLKDAPIVILDEATSQLDSFTEAEIQHHFRHLFRHKTTLVIAHRLATLVYMDRILVFDQGKLVEDGTHTALLAAGGVYKMLWDAQVGGFLPDHQ